MRGEYTANLAERYFAGYKWPDGAGPMQITSIWQRNRALWGNPVTTFSPMCFLISRPLIPMAVNRAGLNLARGGADWPVRNLRADRAQELKRKKDAIWPS